MATLKEMIESVRAEIAEGVQLGGEPKFIDTLRQQRMAQATGQNRFLKTRLDPEKMAAARAGRHFQYTATAKQFKHAGDVEKVASGAEELYGQSMGRSVRAHLQQNPANLKNIQARLRHHQTTKIARVGLLPTDD